MKRFKFFAFALIITSSTFAFAQDENFDSEFSDSTPAPEYIAPEPAMDTSMEPSLDGPVVGTNVNSGAETPAHQPIFKKPPGPKKGGSLMVPHPGTAQGLIRINKDGSYQYKTGIIKKSMAGSFRVGSMSPPKISGPSGISYGDLYGKKNLVGILADYEWQPFRGFGALGVQVGAGIMTSRGNGRFADLTEAKEVYDLYIIPVSLYAVYRFEYVRRQWIVPYILGGGTAYGLIEKRDDKKPASYAIAPAGGFGGGAHFSISRWDEQGAFTMQKEYGVADMWLTAELRIVQGIRQDIDFTNSTASVGVTVDY